MHGETAMVVQGKEKLIILENAIVFRDEGASKSFGRGMRDKIMQLERRAA